MERLFCIHRLLSRVPSRQNERRVLRSLPPFIDKGRVLLTGSPQEIFAKPRHPPIEQFLDIYLVRGAAMLATQRNMRDWRGSNGNNDP